MLRHFIQRNFHGIRGRLLLGMMLIVVLFSLISTTVSVYFMHRQSLDALDFLSNGMTGFFVQHLTTAWSLGDTTSLLENAEEILSSEHILGGALYNADMAPLVTRKRIDFGAQPGLDSVRSALASHPDSANFIVRAGLIKRALVHFRPIYTQIAQS